MKNKLFEQIKKYKKELIFLIAFAIIINIRFPYYIDSPGGTLPLDKRITIENGRNVNGSLNLVYVLEMDATLPTLLVSVFNKNWDIIKKEDVISPNENVEDVKKRGQLSLKESMNNAVINAFRKANEDLEITKEEIYVSYIYEDAETDLKVGDRILEINGEKFKTKQELATLVEKYTKNEKVKIKVLDNNIEKEKYFKVLEIEDSKKIGIVVSIIYTYKTNKNVDFKYSDSENGSSGGFMNSLYIYSALTSEDIIKGRKIVGTGTIDIDGNVGEIGGIEYKIKAAEKSKSDIFFVPENNCNDAIQAKKDKNYKINVVCINNFDDALDYLNK